MELKIAESPIVGYQYLAYPLTVILTDPECLPWYHGNYIQMVCRDDSFNSINFYGGFVGDIPMIKCQSMEKGTFMKLDGDFVRFFVDALNDGWYILSNYDEFFVPHRESYQNTHFDHDFMIYGYDPEKDYFSLLGYSDRGIFEKTEIPYANFKDAFESKVYAPYAPVTLFRKYKNIHYGFDKEDVKNLMIDYVCSRNTADRLKLYSKPQRNIISGMDTYGYLERYYDSLEKDNDKENNMGVHTVRDIRLFWEHKKCMLERLDFMYQNKILSSTDPLENYRLVEAEISRVRNLQIKYSVSGDKTLIQRIHDSLDLAEKREREVLESVIDQL